MNILRRIFLIRLSAKKIAYRQVYVIDRRKGIAHVLFIGMDSDHTFRPKRQMFMPKTTVF